jgi:hypothetical protein
MSFLSLLGGLGGSFLGGPTGGALGSALGGMFDNKRAIAGASSAANRYTQESMDRALGLQKQMYENQLGYNQPYQQAGVNALNRMSSGDVMGPQDTGYNFRLKEGLKALNNTAAARGGLLSAGALNNAQRYGQNMASQEYQNAFNRQGQLAGFGQNANMMLGHAGQNYANQSGNYLMNGSHEMGMNTGNAMLAGAENRQSAYGGIGNELNSVMGRTGFNGFGSNWMNGLFGKGVNNAT